MGCSMQPQVVLKLKESQKRSELKSEVKLVLAFIKDRYKRDDITVTK